MNNLYRQFNATLDLADLPLQAANAYQSIVDALNKAKIAAEEASKAAEKAYNEVLKMHFSLQNMHDLFSN